MKTKIIYISGNEVFDMNDIRAAFEEVRVALNLDKNTVLFGVPVDEDDAGLMSESEPEKTETTEPIIDETIPETVIEEVIEKDPSVAIKQAVKGMLPKGPLGREMLKKLHVYTGAEHPHAAQKPEVLTF